MTSSTSKGSVIVRGAAASNSDLFWPRPKGAWNMLVWPWDVMGHPSESMAIIARSGSFDPKVLFHSACSINPCVNLCNKNPPNTSKYMIILEHHNKNRSIARTWDEILVPCNLHT